MSGLTLPDPLAEALRSADYRIIVTGASGWVGSATLDMLLNALGPEAFSHRVLAYASTARSLALRNGIVVPLSPLEQIAGLPAMPSLIFHYAFLGREKTAELTLDGYCAANARITDIMRRAVERLKPAGMFLTSSGAVYRADRSIETDLAANPYGVLKHRDEAVFANACATAGTKLVTTRVFNLAGEYVNKVSSYALSSFILDALAGRPITIRATRRVERSYVYVGDVVALALTCLLDNEPAPPVFDTVGERVVEVGELAALVREKCDGSHIPIQRAQIDETQPADRYVGDVGTMRRALGLRQLALRRLSQQVKLTLGYLRRVPTAQDAGPRQVA